MNKSVYRKTIDVQKHGSQFTINTVKGDMATRELVLNIVDGGKPFAFNSDAIGIIFLAIKPNGDAVTIATLPHVNNVVTLTLPQGVLNVAGDVKGRIKIVETGTTDQVLYSPEFTIYVDDCEQTDGSAASSGDFTDLEKAIARAETLTVHKDVGATYSTVSIVDDQGVVQSVRIDDGINGVDGQDGADGVGIADVDLVNYELIVTLTDGTEINLGNVRGATGAAGADGQDGADGISPTASVVRGTKKATITITDKNGTTTADVLDGADAEIFYVNYTKEGNTWSSDKTVSAIRSAYLNGQRVAARVFDYMNAPIVEFQLVAVTDAIAVFSCASFDLTASVVQLIDGTVIMSTTSFTDMQTAINSKLNTNQGSANEGKVMTVGADGSLVPDAISVPFTPIQFVSSLPQSNIDESVYYAVLASKLFPDATNFVESGMPYAFVTYTEANGYRLMISDRCDVYGAFSDNPHSYTTYKIYNVVDGDWTLLYDQQTNDQWASRMGLPSVSSYDAMYFANANITHANTGAVVYNTSNNRTDITGAVLNASDRNNNLWDVYNYENSDWSYLGRNNYTDLFAKVLANYYTETEVDTALGNKINTSAIKQTTGSSTTDLMSQDAVTDALATKQDLIDYSTEKVIGTWINGKPLYQKSFSITLPDNVNASNTGIDCTGIDDVVKIEGTINYNGYYYTFNGSWYRTSNERIAMYYRKTNPQINAYTGNNFLNMPCVVTVQYTKTTDTATS